MRISFSSWATRESVRFRGRRLCGATKTQDRLPFAHRWHWLGVDGLGRQRTLRLRQDSQDLFNCWFDPCGVLDSPLGVEVSGIFTYTHARNCQGMRAWLFPMN